MDIIADMVTKIRQSRTVRRRHLYLDEWFDFRGVNDEKIAGRLGMDRTAIWKWRKQQNRLDPEKIAALASALDCEPEELWRLPGEPSLDAIVRSASGEVRAMALDIVSRLVAKKG